MHFNDVQFGLIPLGGTLRKLCEIISVKRVFDYLLKSRVLNSSLVKMLDLGEQAFFDQLVSFFSIVYNFITRMFFSFFNIKIFSINHLSFDLVLQFR